MTSAPSQLFHVFLWGRRTQQQYSPEESIAVTRLEWVC